MVQKMRLLGWILIVAAMGIASCQSEPTPTFPVSPLATPQATIEETLGVSPIPSDTNSPLATPMSSAPPEAAPLEGPPFALDEPLRQNDVQVTGTGPQGIPIVIADITLMGETLGRGTIGTDGRFTLPVTPPLTLNHRVGILLDPQTTEIQYTEELLAQLEAFRGDNSIAIPRIGTVYDAASVQP